MRNWRVGIEARISHLKRAFGLRRTRLRRLGGARTWVGLGIFAYNLQRMTVVDRMTPTDRPSVPTSSAPQGHPYQDFFRGK